MHAHLDLPSLDTLNYLFRYHPETGILERLRWGQGPAGYLTSNGYLRVKVNHTHYRVSRLVWYMYYGEEPPKNMSIDHINRNRDDNRITNLRLVSHKENHANRTKPPRKPKPAPLSPEERQQINIEAGKRRRKPVIVDTGGEIKTYDSVTAAAKVLNISISLLSQILTGKASQREKYTVRFA